MPRFAVTIAYIKEHIAALLQTHQTFKRIAFRRRTLEEELQEAVLRGSLRKAFGGLDLLLLGLGIVIGSGWAQLTGSAAQQYAGPAIVISYLVAGLTALLSGTCYAELCTEYPVSGGAFSYVLVTFGELPAFITLSGLVLEYALGMAAVARGFSDYLATLIGADPTSPPFEFAVSQDKGHGFDIVAAVIIMVMSVLLSLGVRESAWFISGVTLVKLVLLLIVCVASYTQGSTDNMNPFTNTVWDADGIFMGSSIIFFSFTGYDAIGNAAEEVQNVAHLPWAIMGTVLTSTTIYLMLALGLALMICPTIACPALFFMPILGTKACSDLGLVAGCTDPPCTCPTIAPTPAAAPAAPSPDAAPTNCYLAVNFISAFLAHGMVWMQYIVSLAALFGIVTALTVGLFSLSRIVMAASRDWLLPPFLARISPRTQTPLVAQMVFGVIIALLAMLVEVDAATSLVSFGTLITLWMVCNAQLFRRYTPEVQMRFTRYGTVEVAAKIDTGSRVPGRLLSQRVRSILVWLHLALINAVTIGMASYYADTSYVDTTPFGEPVNWDENACNPAAQNKHHSPYATLFVLGWFLVTLSFQLCCPMEYQPEGFHIPWWLMPWLPSVAIALLVFSVGSLPRTEYWKIAIYFGIVVLLYLLFSLPMSYIKHSRADRADAEELKVVELACVNGHWQPARTGPGYVTGAMHPATSAHSSAGTHKDSLPHPPGNGSSDIACGSGSADAKGSGRSGSGRHGANGRRTRIRGAQAAQQQHVRHQPLPTTREAGEQAPS
ncbi:hypothetical protein D9Q98_001827 [Chlorella vulgaris]|uniref:Cationic amino acid transporter n=1 Tax=Chlorella vulgaris TaxID=3077 RepID=A0A9D4TVC0_CHLVU|nr:hypothetical protein D9Q98_001827 [Chlorella vulgaris]